MKKTATRESEMQITARTLEAKQDELRQFDPDKLEQLTDEFMEYIASLQHAPMSRNERGQETRGAEAIYEKAIDAQIRDQRNKFYSVWDALEEADKEMMYRYMQDAPLRWLDEREEGR